MNDERTIHAEDTVSLKDDVRASAVPARKDWPVGDIVFRDAKTGKVIRHTHNMIVDEGLRFLLWLVTNSITGDTTYLADSRLLSIVFAFDGSDSSNGLPPNTTKDMTYADIVSHSAEPYQFALTGSNLSVSLSALTLTITATISGNNIPKFNNFCIIYGKDSDLHLFSRGVMDPMFLPGDYATQMVYTIHF